VKKHTRAKDDDVIERQFVQDYAEFALQMNFQAITALELRWVRASLEQLEVAVKQVAKLYIRSLELLWLFMLHYYPQHGNKVP
jgi:hypothetical protein